jgi:hypothetical protein
MKLFFADISTSSLADSDSKILYSIKKVLLTTKGVIEVYDPEWADAIIIEEKNSFKNFRYIKELVSDKLISAHPQKVFTINTDDCATGLLRGLYTSLPKHRFNVDIYKSVPYMYFPNDLVFSAGYNKVDPPYLASWRGNTKSNRLRIAIVNSLSAKDNICIQKTDSWLNHDNDEKSNYVNLIRAAKFSICPAGWAPVSFRIYESMALGTCPVIIADNFVPPKGPNWNSFALFYPEKTVMGLSSFLLSKEHLAHDFGENAYRAWQKYFSADVISSYYADALLSLIGQAPKTSKAAEFKRWRSLKLNWDNKWTVPQRIISKIKKVLAN